MLEKKIEEYLVREVKKLGGIAYKFTSPARRGVPDRICVFNGMINFVELKNETGKLSELQKLEHAKLRNLGQDVYVLWSKGDVDSYIEIMKDELEGSNV